MPDTSPFVVTDGGCISGPAGFVWVVPFDGEGAAQCIAENMADACQAVAEELEGQLAAMRDVLNRLVCCVLDCSTCERAGSPDGKSDCPQRIIRKALTAGAAEKTSTMAQ